MSGPSTAPASALAAAPRPSTDLLPQTLRLVRWELFQLWRRVMTKVLLGILLGLYALYMAFYLLGYALTGNTDGGVAQRAIVGQLSFPASIGVALGYATFMGVVLLGIAAGVLVGSEYGQGTQRLALSRGVERWQALAAKVGALAVVAGIIVAGMLALGVLVGVTIGPLLGGSLQAMTAGAVPQLLAYWASVALRLFMYSLIGLFFATLGRSSAGGIGGVLGFVVVEIVGLGILTAIEGVAIASARATGLPTPDFVPTLDAIRFAFPQTNADALTVAAQQGPLAISAAVSSTRVEGLVLSTPPTVQALLVMLAWCAGLIGLSYVLLRSRDVTD
jgi:ABC-type transport system involved in multi-copper enzyme maturation permease subunit